MGLHPSPDIDGVADGFASLAAVDARRAFLHTARSIIETSGQRVSATDRLYPVAHARAAAAAMPGSRLEVFESAHHSRSTTSPSASSTP
jgi:hypothetical protein